MVHISWINQYIANLKHENIRKIATGQRDDSTTGSLLDYSYFKENYKMIAKDLSKQQILDADPIQQINFTANLERAGNTKAFFIIEEAKETVTRNCKSFVNTIPQSNLIFTNIK